LALFLLLYHLLVTPIDTMMAAFLVSHYILTCDHTSVVVQGHRRAMFFLF